MGSFIGQPLVSILQISCRYSVGERSTVVDEVHHLAAAQDRRIVGKASAPYRLGLSATPERAGGRHRDLDTLISLVVFRRWPNDLRRQRHIADYVERRIYVDLSPVEQERYELLMAQFR